MLFKLKSSIAILFIVLVACTGKKQMDSNDLFNAVHKNNKEQIEEILQEGIGPNVMDSLGNTILFVAVKNKDKELVQYLLGKKVDPNLLNKEELSALDIARKNKESEIIELLHEFQHKDWLKGEDKFTEEAFEYAVDNDNVKIVADFIDNGRDPNLPCVSKGLAPVIHAIFTDSYEVIYYLLDHEANPDVTFDTRPAIATAALFNQYGVVKKLIEKKADVNFADGPFFNALILSAEEGNTEIVALLLANGADKTLKDMNGETALDKATKNNHQAVIDLLTK